MKINVGKKVDKGLETPMNLGNYKCCQQNMYWKLHKLMFGVIICHVHLTFVSKKNIYNSDKPKGHE